MSLIDEGTGQELAREELAKPEYAQAAPGLVERVLSWLGDRLNDLLEATSTVPGGSWLLVLLLVAVGLGLALLAGKVVFSPGRGKEQVFSEDHEQLHQDYLAIAAAEMDSGDWDAVLIAATRAIVRDLQSRGTVSAGNAITITECRTQVHDPALQATLLEFERVRYGNANTSQEAAKRAYDLARHGAPSRSSR
ncbi:MAG: hypothetical protein K0U64_09155 [Actinomycetia bacterium]|nr:hypothetical protein [Actinomycetes bacterium]